MEPFLDEDPVQLDEDFRNVVIVDGLPKVGTALAPKLTAVVRKLFGPPGPFGSEGVVMPAGEDGTTMGYAFVEYKERNSASRACKELNGKKLDAAHTLIVSPYSSFEDAVNADPNFKDPAAPEPPSAADDIDSWLLDEFGRDQLVLRHKSPQFEETQIYWHDPRRMENKLGRDLSYGGETHKAGGVPWTEMLVSWSPVGSFLATLHSKGVLCWGGPKYSRRYRFTAAGVDLIQFSPREKYLLTYASLSDEKSDGSAMSAHVWDVASERILRSFMGRDLKRYPRDPNAPRDGGASMAAPPSYWPFFHWSPDERFVATLGQDKIGVFRLPEVDLAEKKSIKVPGVRECFFSPKDNYLAYWALGSENQPSGVAIREFPGSKIVREQHIYSVGDVKMSWQPSGDHLAVVVTRVQSKTRRSYALEVFFLREKNVPIATLELGTEFAGSIAWSPSGNLLALLCAEDSRKSVRFFSLAQRKIEALKILQDRPTQAQSLHWSPSGLSLVVFSAHEQGTLEFIDTSGNQPSFNSICSRDHAACNYVSWDPSGRFLLSAVLVGRGAGITAFKYTKESGYRLWRCQGTPLVFPGTERSAGKISVDDLWQIMWRPRPSAPLTREQKEEKYLREKYWKAFEQEDERLRQAQLSGEARKRAQAKDAWKKYRADVAKQMAEEEEHMRQLIPGLDEADEDYEIVETIFEEEIGKEVVRLS